MSTERKLRKEEIFRLSILSDPDLIEELKTNRSPRLVINEISSRADQMGCVHLLCYFMRVGDVVDKEFYGTEDLVEIAKHRQSAHNKNKKDQKIYG